MKKLLSFILLICMFMLVSCEEAKNEVYEEDLEDENLTVYDDRVYYLIEDFSMLEYRKLEIQLTTNEIIVETIFQADDTIPNGYIIYTEPESGEILQPGDTIKLYVSSGHDPAINNVEYDEESLEIIFYEIVFTLPEEWQGKCTSHQETIREGDASVDFITVYHTKTKDLYPDGGVLFYIGRRQYYGQFPEDEVKEWAGGSEIIFDTDEYTYILTIPTDVQYLVSTFANYDKDIADEYFMLAEQIPEIKASVRKIN